MEESLKFIKMIVKKIKQLKSLDNSINLHKILKYLI